MEKHKHYEAARRAHYWTSFSPEKRAESDCKYFDETIAELKSIGCSEEGIAKFERLFLLSLSAKSRCMSSIITGPAKFPTAKAEKANARVHKITSEMLDYVERVRKAIDKQNNPQNYAISSDSDNALPLLKEKLVKLKDAQSQMKLANKIIKGKGSETEKLERLQGIFNRDCSDLLKPDFCGRIGFASFELSNNNAKIKATELRIAELKKAASRKTRELNINGIRILENAEENRVQFYFGGKPAQNIIDLMKSNGFKWSPMQGCWQRLWNNNAIWAVNHYILPAIKQIALPTIE